MANKYAMNVDQGSTWNVQITIATNAVAWDLTGYTARMKVRPTVDSATVTLSLTDTDGITLGGAAGTVVLNRSATVTAALVAGSYVYDLELVSGGGVVTRILQGPFVVSAEVTR